MAAVLDQTGNSIGDCHLPRGKLIYLVIVLTILILNYLATLNLIIRESLPNDVRAHKDTMDLICFISNAFVDLLSDTSNNVCYSHKRRNIIPEHTVRALQEMHLDDYLPFLLSDNQSMTIQEILKTERKKPDGLHLNMKQISDTN